MCDADRTPQLTAAIASGDTEALAVLYEQWFDRLYLEARRTTGRDESFCLDVVQDTMIKVIKSIKPLPDEQSLAGWLRVVVRRCAYDRLRSEKRRVAREERQSHESLTNQQPDTARIDWLREQLLAVDAEHARLLTMRHRFGWTLRQIGEQIGLKPGAVDGRLKRITDNLRRKAQEDFDES